MIMISVGEQRDGDSGERGNQGMERERGNQEIIKDTAYSQRSTATGDTALFHFQDTCTNMCTGSA